MLLKLFKKKKTLSINIRLYDKKCDEKNKKFHPLGETQKVIS